MKFQVKKDNKKFKIGITIVGVIIAILAIFLITNGLIQKSKQKYVVEQIADKDIKYYKYISKNKTGVIDNKGNIIIAPEYDTIKIPNPTKGMFICVYDYNIGNGEYKTKVLNEKQEAILTDYENVDTIEIKEVVSNVPFEKSVLKYEKNGKYGLINFEGKEITKPIYESIRNMPYREGELIAKLNGKYGVISINGGKLLDFKYNLISGDGYYNKDSKYKLDGYIVATSGDNKKGKNNENEISEDATQYAESSEVITNGNFKYGYINSERKEILQLDYTKVSRIVDVPDDKNIYLVAEKEGKIQLYKNNKLLLDNYTDITYDESSNLLIVKKDDTYGVVDLTGKIILNPEFNQIKITGDYISAIKNNQTTMYNFSGEQQNNVQYESVINIENKDYKITKDSNLKYGIIDKNGGVLVPNQYNYIGYLFGDYFIASNENSLSGIIDITGKEILPINNEVVQKIEGFDAIEVKLNGTLAIINNKMQKVVEMPNGNIILEENYIKAYSPTDTQYVGTDGTLKSNIELFANNKLFAIGANGKWGFVDKNGNQVIEKKYDKVTDFNSEGFAGIKLNGKWGVIDENGNIVVDPIYEISDQNNEPDFIGKYYKVVSGYEDYYYSDDVPDEKDNGTDGVENSTGNNEENIQNNMTNSN